MKNSLIQKRRGSTSVEDANLVLQGSPAVKLWRLAKSPLETCRSRERTEMILNHWGYKLKLGFNVCI